MSEGSLNVLQIPHVTTCWQTFLGLADREFLARVPGIFHCLTPGVCEEEEAVWLPAFSFCFLWQSHCLSSIQLYIYPMRTLTTPFNNKSLLQCWFCKVLQTHQFTWTFALVTNKIMTLILLSKVAIEPVLSVLGFWIKKWMTDAINPVKSEAILTKI